MEIYNSRLGPKVALVAVTMLMSGCWTAPNANLRPKGEPRVIEDSVDVEIAMPPVRVEFIDRAKRILVASSREAPMIEMNIAPGVRNVLVIARRRCGPELEDRQAFIWTLASTR